VSRQEYKIGVVVVVGLNSPHILLASSNPQKMLKNLEHILDAIELSKIQGEIDSNVIALFKLGHDHFIFAKSLQDNNWRQKISRFYYGAYNIRRAVALHSSGAFSTDSSDHKNVDTIPDQINNAQSYKTKLRVLREDRNLADYSHLARPTDLVMSVEDTGIFVEQFSNDCKAYLVDLGIAL
jgi:hypothetical protein